MFDASNKGNTKMCPFFIQYLSTTRVKKGIVVLMNDAEGTALKIFANACQLIVDNELDINELATIGADDTNVNVGENHLVFSLFKDELPDIFKEQSVLLFDQVKAIIDTQNTTTTNNCNDDEEDDDNEHSTTYKIVRIDQL
ncbi:unnamed protein product [Rotaria sordida]|uniref:Uncharacterized protein n=1 Tax=Rotaria sordida TaxID=392033 RepID=A0A813S2W2_9BILA|nr:unnamed protein product [Rotaria sordida]CAF0804889.1 unnamed protein product [Rotaria sordida]CAF0805778.1 unnamed protein product [Rotaria sordida]